MLDAVLVDRPAEAVADLDAWWARHLATQGATPIARAVAAGASMDRVGYAFASGYQEALRSMFGRGAGDGPAALSVTEETGIHPRALSTTVADGRLSGRKKWATLTPPAETIYVAARRGERPDGRPDLVVVRVPVAAVDVEPGPQAPFCPEIPHASLRFDAVEVPPDAVLPGDGWSDYVKPFRTVEDVFVHAAVFAHLARVGTAAGWPRSLVERMVAVIASLASIAEMDPNARATHIALAGAISLSSAMLEEIDAAHEDPRWPRDRPLLTVAAGARERRREAAYRSS